MAKSIGTMAQILSKAGESQESEESWLRLTDLIFNRCLFFFLLGGFAPFFYIIMKNTSEVYKSIDYLKQRFLLDRINVSWRDKESLKNIIDYVREFEFKDEVDNRYIINAMTWGFVQVLLLKLEDRELSSHLIREVLWKLEEVLNAPASRLEVGVGS